MPFTWEERTWEGGLVWSLAKAHFSGVKSNGKTSRLVVLGSVWDIISPNKRWSKCPFYDSLHISGVFTDGQECSDPFGWHTAISPFSVSRATGVPWPTSSSSVQRTWKSLRTARGHVNLIAAQRDEDGIYSAVTTSPVWKGTNPGALHRGLIDCIGLICSLLPKWWAIEV